MAGETSPPELPLPEPPFSVAEACACEFAERFVRSIASTAASLPLPPEADDFALACLLLANEHGSRFGDKAWAALNGCEQAVALRGWYDVLSWRLVLETSLPASKLLPALRELIANLDHHNSNLRGWMLHLGWFTRDRLPVEAAAPKLLKNVADTLRDWSLSFGLFRSLFPQEETAWLEAEKYTPAGFTQQYDDRLKELRSRGLAYCQGVFWHRELRVRRMIESHAGYLRASSATVSYAPS